MPKPQILKVALQSLFIYSSIATCSKITDHDGRHHRLPRARDCSTWWIQTIRGGQVQTTFSASIRRNIPHSYLPTQSQDLRLVQLWSLLEWSLVRRSVQVDPYEVQTCKLQRIRVRLLQALQLQALSQCSLLQRHSSTPAQVGQQDPQRFLGCLGSCLFLGLLRLLDLHLLQVRPTALSLRFLFK